MKLPALVSHKAVGFGRASVVQRRATDAARAPIATGGKVAANRASMVLVACLRHGLYYCKRRGGGHFPFLQHMKG